MDSDLSSVITLLTASTERSLSLVDVFAAILISISLGVLIGVTYEKTHAGATYSRSFVQTIILGSLVSTVIIFAIGNNVARGLGILGALAIIRFRTPIRDPRDMIFIFASLAIGVSCGSRLFSLGAAGTLAFCATIYILDMSPYSTRKRYDGLLRLLVPSDDLLKDQCLSILKANTKSHEIVAMRDAGVGEELEYAIQVNLLHPNLHDRLIDELRSLTGVKEVSLVMQRDTVEI